VKSAEERSRFARTFARVYRDVSLPSVYREFILTDAYVRYRRAVIRGLWSYGPADVELDLRDQSLLNRDQLFDESDIDPDVGRDYHPIAILRESPQFLAIDRTIDAAPIFLWHHETGAFHPQFDSFVEFVGRLRTPAEVQRERAEVRAAFTSIRKVCQPALARARKAFHAGRLAEAGATLDAALAGRARIRYDGRNDFRAIGILCDCFNLRGRVLLAEGRVAEARAAFLDAAGCGGTRWWEAAVDAIAASFLLGDVRPAFDVAAELEGATFPEPPAAILKRNFTARDVARLRAAAASEDLDAAERRVAAQLAAWLAGT